MKISTLLRLAAPAVILFALNGTASAGTFLQIFQANSAVPDFSIVDNGGSNSISIINGGFVNFQFSVPNVLGTGIRAGTLVLNATSSTASTVNGGNLIENGFTGTATLFDTATSTVALHWVFGPTGTLTVATNGTGGTFGDSLPPAGEVTMTSPYLTFSNITSESFSFGLSGGSPAFTADGSGFINSSVASSVGTFDATPVPSGSPEPATMTLFGSALVGLGIFGRKRLARR